ncbi:Membrane-associated progesterone receptor component 2 [Intoshia linei]|uniref:Membrane-associated progesterone receptor component 2 n=1 Tax=Intoshia linei TaxID=1819745 RepID=A0A177B3X6_9BILA|nr:Membrane-associated progesterone receptor component 2 [Intoshia linei]
MSFITDLFNELIHSPFNIVLTIVSIVLIYKIYVAKKKSKLEKKAKVIEGCIKLKTRNYTLEQLRQYNGKKPGCSNILIAIRNNVYDVSKSRDTYSEDGRYAILAGGDASRALATFTLKVSDTYDDLNNLTPDQIKHLNEWERQFKEKYEIVGQLLKPDEIITDYTNTTSESEKEDN